MSMSMDSHRLFRFFLVWFLFAVSGKVANKKTAKHVKKVSSPLENSGSSVEIGVVTWNLAEKAPQVTDATFLKSFKRCDLVVVGVQELEDIRPRRNEGHRTRNLRNLQENALGKAFDCIAEDKMGGLQLSVFANKKARKLVEDVELREIACGVGNVLTNKGAVMVFLRLRGNTLALVDAHFAAHQNKVCGAV